MNEQENINVTGFKVFPFFNDKQPVFILVLLGFVFYLSSLFNEYALDDGIVIHQNDYVLKGASGIPDILTKDVYHGFYKRMCASDQLSGGRYRPLSVITYAIEQQFIQTYRTGQYMRVYDANNNGKLDDEKVAYTDHCGKPTENYEFNDYIDENKDGKAQANECYTCWDRNKNFQNDFDEDLNKDGVYNEVDCQVYGAAFRHFNNIWLYVITCVALYILLRRYLLNDKPDMAFLAALIFLIHPIHSEVVANIRGRDDILSLLFAALTLIFVFRYSETQRLKYLIPAGVCFMLALLSKEFALMLVFIIPASLYFKYGKAVNRPVYFTLLPVLLIYAVFRYLAVGFYMAPEDSELLNNPFLYANGAERFATKTYILLKYLYLLIFPVNLVSDYSYNTIPYRGLASWDFIVSLLVHLVLMILAVRGLMRRSLIGYALTIYLIYILSISNLFFPSQILMLEANTFHASVGFSILVSALVFETRFVDSVRSSSIGKNVFLFLVLIIGVWSWFMVRERNHDWKNDITLFLKDVKKAPNSVLVLGNAGARWIDLADTKEISGVAIPGQDSTIFNDYNGTLVITDEEMKAGGFKTKREAALKKGIGYLKRAVELHPRYVNGYLNLGLAHFKLNDDKNAIYYWKMAEQLYPNNPYLMNYYTVYKNLLEQRGTKACESGDFKEASAWFGYLLFVNPDDARGMALLAGVYFNAGNKAKAMDLTKKALRIDPEQKEALQMLDVLEGKSMFDKSKKTSDQTKEKVHKQAC